MHVEYRLIGCGESLSHSILISVPDCGVPPSPGVNGQVDYVTTTYLADANYSCSLGYDLGGGVATRICSLGGTWSGEDPVCQSKFMYVSECGIHHDMQLHPKD